MYLATVAAAFLAVAVSCCAVRVVGSIRNRFRKLDSKCDDALRTLLNSLRQEHESLNGLLEMLRDDLPFEAQAIEEASSSVDQATTKLQSALVDSTCRNQLMAVAKSESAMRLAVEKLVGLCETIGGPDEASRLSLAAFRLTQETVLDSQMAYNDLAMIFNAFRTSFPATVFALPLGYVREREQFVLSVSDVAEVSHEYAVA